MTTQEVKHFSLTLMRFNNAMLYMRMNKELYSSSEIASLFSNSSERSIFDIVAVLKQAKIDEINKNDIAQLCFSNESKLREIIHKSKSKRVLDALASARIDKNEIIAQKSERKLENINVLNFIELVVRKQDLNIIKIFHRAMKLDEKALKDMKLM